MCRLIISGEFATDMRSPPLELKILLESSPPKSRILVRRRAVVQRGVVLPMSVHKNTPPEKKTAGNISFQNTESVGWIAVCFAGLQGEGLCKGSVVFTDTGILRN